MSKNNLIITSEQIGDEIIKIWNFYSDKYFCEISPLIPKFIKKKSILFIGLNPSIRKNDKPEKYNKKLYTYDVRAEKDVYFGRFWNFAEKANFKNKWTHFDLLFLRSDQKYVEKLIKDKKECGDVFIRKQLQLSKKLLELSKPKMIIISNKLAGKLTGKDKFEKKGKIYDEWMNLKFEKFDDHYLLNEIPVIFSRQPNHFFSKKEMNELIEKIIKIKKQYKIFI